MCSLNGMNVCHLLIRMNHLPGFLKQEWVSLLCEDDSFFRKQEEDCHVILMEIC